MEYGGCILFPLLKKVLDKDAFKKREIANLKCCHFYVDK